MRSVQPSPRPSVLRRAQRMRWLSRAWAVVAVSIALASLYVASETEEPGFWVWVAIVALVSVPFALDQARDAAVRGTATMRTAWWAAVRAGLLPTTAPMPPVRPAPDRVVGRAGGRSRGPSRELAVVYALIALALVSYLLSNAVLRGVGDLTGEVGEVFFFSSIVGFSAFFGGIWCVAIALAPKPQGPVVVEGDADELWIQLREARGSMPTPRNAVQTRSWPWPAIRSAILRGSRDGARLRYLGLYLTDPNGTEYTYDLTDIDVSVGDLEAMLTERAGLHVHVQVAPE